MSKIYIHNFLRNARGMLLLACLVAVFYQTNAVYAAPARVERAYNEARSEYLRLSSRDPRVKDLMRWEKAASDLLIFTREYSDPDYTPKAFYLLGRLYEYTYQKRRFQTGLTRALYFYEKLAKEHTRHYLADDALLYLGDLQRDALNDKGAATQTYEQILVLHPRGDMVAKARTRLGLKAGESPKPRDLVARDDTAESTSPRSPSRASSSQASPSKEPEEEESGGLLGIFKRSPSVGEEGLEIYSKPDSKFRPVIVIDPGHGGEEDGAKGVDGVMEKDVVLAISFMLEDLLKERLRAKTLLTRREDIHVPLEERTALANKSKADLFISVHTNASVYKTAKGIETYYLDNTNDKSSLKLAERENASIRSGGRDDLSFMLSDLIQNAKLDESISLAHYVQDALHGTLSRYYKGVKSLGVKRAPFYVLVGAHMPCVLVEVSFIDHPVEGRRLISRRYQKLVAASLYEGVREYFESL